MAYQIAFDLYDSATQQFLQRVRHTLRPAPVTEKTTASTDSMETDEATGEPK